MSVKFPSQRKKKIFLSHCFRISCGVTLVPVRYVLVTYWREKFKPKQVLLKMFKTSKMVCKNYSQLSHGGQVGIYWYIQV